MLKRVFQEELAATLKLRRVTAPLFVFSGTGMNDDLNGVERAVSFPIKDMNDRRAEVVHSLAKWKRMKLGFYNIPPGEGLYTDMNAIRADEELDNIHSIYVDQWDWERTIHTEDHHLDFLRMIVDQIMAFSRRWKKRRTVLFRILPRFCRRRSRICMPKSCWLPVWTCRLKIGSMRRRRNTVRFSSSESGQPSRTARNMTAALRITTTGRPRRLTGIGD